VKAIGSSLGEFGHVRVGDNTGFKTLTTTGLHMNGLFKMI